MHPVAKRLTGAALPALVLPATNGQKIDLSSLPGTNILYIYPRTSPPDGTAIPGWAEIPGAKGCTPQSCGFRDHFADLTAAGATAIFGLSVQNTAYQAEAAARLHLPFPLLSDADLRLRDALDLPTFEAGGMVLLSRMTMIIKDATISHILYPVENPARNAEDVLSLLRTP